MDAERRLPWWKEIVLNDEYRQRIRRLVTARYREEIRILQDSPEQIAPARWDDGNAKHESAQFISVRETEQWATKHPMSVIKVSAFRVLRSTASAVVLPSSVADEEACVLNEIGRMFQNEKEESRLYGLSYLWDCQLPPNGFIRLRPNPLSAMWPRFPGEEETKGIKNKVEPPPSFKNVTQRDPLCVNVYRENGEYLGVWRQSLLLLRFKITCWALREEERQRTSTNAFPAIPVLNRTVNASPILKDVPVFPLPLLRLQSGTVTYKRETCCVDVDSIESPRTWEGIAPSPTSHRAELTYQNWHTLHRNSTIVYQSLRDIYELLPHNEDGFLTKETYVEFTLDLLELFFPTFLSSTSIAIAEEEWAFRGTTELVSFGTFFEKFFSFPLILLRDLNHITREQYAEVWCLVRVCILERSDTIGESASYFDADEGDTTDTEKKKKNGKEKKDEEVEDVMEEVVVAEREKKQRLRSRLLKKLNSKVVFLQPDLGKSTTNDKGKTDWRIGTFADNPVRRHVSAMGATISSVQKLQQTKGYGKPKDVVPLICRIIGLKRADVMSLGGKNFRNNDNYALYCAKKSVARDEVDFLRWLPPSHLANVLHTRGEQMLAKATTKASATPQNLLLKKYGDSSLHGTCTFSGSSNVDDRDSDDDLNTDSKENTQVSGLAAFPSFASMSLADSLRTRSQQLPTTSHPRIDRVSERLAALARLEEERVARQLRETSVLYQMRQRRWHREHRAVLMRIMRSHSGWELYHDDVFEVPVDVGDTEDALVSYVLDFPDDFFDDPQHSLRERYAIHQALLAARARQQRNDQVKTLAWNSTFTSTIGTNTYCSERVPSPSSLAVSVMACSRSATTLHVTPHSNIASRCCVRNTPTPIPCDQHWSDMSLAGWSRKDAAPLLQSVRVFMRAPWGVKDLPPVLTASEFEPPRDPLADSDPSIWLPPRGDSDEEGEEGQTQAETGLPQSGGIHPRRALQLRLNARRRIDAQYLQNMQARPRKDRMPHTARVVKTKAHNSVGRATLPFSTQRGS